MLCFRRMLEPPTTRVRKHSNPPVNTQQSAVLAQVLDVKVQRCILLPVAKVSTMISVLTVYNEEASKNLTLRI